MWWPERKWAWAWAWRRFLRWALLEGRLEEIDARQRWQVVRWTVIPGIRHHFLKPVVAMLHTRLPTRVLLMRLERRGHGWYRVPDVDAALHAWRRLGVVVHEGSRPLTCRFEVTGCVINI